MASVQPVIRFDLNKDVRTVEAMAARLLPYIYENEIYGPMPGDLPRLTVGSLLMRLHRLSAVADLLSSEQRSTLNTARQQFDQVRKDWSVAYETKLLHELNARLSSLLQFIAECQDNPPHCGDLYPSNAEKRVIAEELKDEAATRNVFTPTLQAELSGIDNKLHQFFSPGEFTWDARLKSAYPREKYWFLYVKPNA